MKKYKGILEVFLDFFEITIIGTTIFILVYLFVGQLLEISGDSMYPTLVDKEQIIAEKISTKFKPLEREEIVIFKHPENQKKLLVKRVIGLPGETIQIKDGQIYINGVVLNQPYITENTYTKGSKELIENIEYRIHNNQYILLGDNRDESSDSRTFGQIPEKTIMGRALMVYFPFGNIRMVQH